MTICHWKWHYLIDGIRVPIQRFHLIPERYGRAEGRTDRLSVCPSVPPSVTRHVTRDKKSSDFREILYTAADFELDERHMIKNEKVALDRL